MEQPQTPLDQTFRQVIILSEAVEFVISNDILFSTETLKEIPVRKWFPMIESIHESLKGLKIGDEEIQFSRVESPAEFLPGAYDFSFTKIEMEDRAYIQWNIYDYTNVYTYWTKYQQLKNEKDIHRQRLEYGDKQVETFDDLI
ncbi:MAG: hypothetical protein AAF573_13535 [Bacteroidota bacterium]